ncbi:MAG: hypothetical protein M5U09_22545 [Gammaproteobacteria bacterium]|nr:hypothetical protein [Gammaproteobacteria bacterium]
MLVVVRVDARKQEEPHGQQHDVGVDQVRFEPVASQLRLEVRDDAKAAFGRQMQGRRAGFFGRAGRAVVDRVQPLRGRGL